MTIRLRVLAVLLAAAACSPRPRVRTGPALAPAPRLTPDTLEATRFDRAVQAGTRSRTGRPGPRYWQQYARYTIEGTLDPRLATLTGHESVWYVNHSPDTLPVLVLDLYQNAFAPGAPHDQPMPVTGGLKLSSVSAGGTPLHEEASDAQPGYTVDFTIGRLRLPRPLAPGDSVRLEFAWSYKLPPKTSPRGGTDGQVFVVAYWFPRVAVYDDVLGWDTDPYLGRGEFYMDYGDYDVSITLPDDQLVAATGVLANADAVLSAQTLSRLADARRTGQLTSIVTKDDRGAGRATRRGAGGLLTWRFHADSVRDFVWASSKDYVWDATGARVGDRTGTGKVDSTAIYTFYRPGAFAWAKSTVYLKQSIQFLSNLLWPYPYPHMTAVEGFVNGGMEFPMLTHIGGVEDGNNLYIVTVHETSHMWFPMLVGSDETRFAWMDEGLASYNEALGARDFLGFDEWKAQQQLYILNHARGLDEPLMVHADAFPSDELYQNSAYTKPAVVMRALRGVLGDSVFLRAYREYGRRWTNRLPRPEDFFDTFNDVSGQDLSWFWKAWFFGIGDVDQGIAGVTIHGDSARIVLENLGSIPMPVPLEITRKDHSTQRLTVPVAVWLKGAVRDTLSVGGSSPVESVVIDPDEWFPDLNRGNNRWGAAAVRPPERRRDRRPTRVP